MLISSNLQYVTLGFNFQLCFEKEAQLCQKQRKASPKSSYYKHSHHFAPFKNWFPSVPAQLMRLERWGHL